LHLGASGEPSHDLCEILLRTYGLTIDTNNNVSSALDMVTLYAQAGSRCWGTWEDLQYFDSPHLALGKRFAPNAQICLPR
jgi:hypothetical protein